MLLLRSLLTGRRLARRWASSTQPVGHLCAPLTKQVTNANFEFKEMFLILR